MADIIETFGGFVERQIPKRPLFARRLLLTAYRAYGWKLKHIPNKNLGAAKNYLGALCMDFIVSPLSHPEAQVLTSMFTPCEVFFAMGLYPMCAEQYSTYTNGAGAEQVFVRTAENAGISETYCSYHKILTGAAVSGVMPKPAAIVNTSLACDANNLTFRKAAELFSAPQFYIDIPYEPCEEAVCYVADQMKDMTAWLEDITGRKADLNKLNEALALSRETVRTMHEVMALRKDRYISAELTSELYEALLMHNALGRPGTLTYARMLKEDFLNSKVRPGKKIIWMQTNPFYQKTAKTIFDYSRDPWIMITELCYDSLIDMDDCDPYRAMARRVVYNYYNGPISRRIEKAADTARALEADGVILFCHWGCKETCGAAALIEKALTDAGIPTLVLNGDGVDRRNNSDGQLKTRIGAFLEMLEERR